MAKKQSSFRIGRVRAFLRGSVWYLSYFEQGQRRQPRVGPDRGLAKATEAEINGQLEVGAPSALGFESASFVTLRQRWLDHHEHVRRSSLNTIRRYRTAKEHLLNFVEEVRSLKKVSDLRPLHIEEFTRKVAPNGNKNAAKSEDYCGVLRCGAGCLLTGLRRLAVPTVSHASLYGTSFW